MDMKRQAGFTVVELLVAIVILVTAGILVIHQKDQIDKVDRDRQRKTAINAMYYSLEEVYYPAKGSYPLTISQNNLTSLDPVLFKDPFDKKIGETGSSYRYDALGCEGDVCKSYTLRTTLEAEADYVKKSRH